MDQTRLNFFKNYKFLKTNTKKSKFNLCYSSDVELRIKTLITDFIYFDEVYYTSIKFFKNGKKITQVFNSKSIHNKVGFKKHSIYF